MYFSYDAFYLQAIVFAPKIVLVEIMLPKTNRRGVGMNALDGIFVKLISWGIYKAPKRPFPIVCKHLLFTKPSFADMYYVKAPIIETELETRLAEWAGLLSRSDCYFVRLISLFR